MGHVTVGEFFFPACAACLMSACAISIDKEAKQDFQQVTYLCNVVFFYYYKVFLWLALQLTTVKQCFQLKLLAMLVQNNNCREMAQVKDRLIQKLSFLIQNPEVRNHGIQILGPFLNLAGFEGIFCGTSVFRFCCQIGLTSVGL